jgi:hypothetical protein
MFGLFKKQDRPPRIAYREQRDGTKNYYVEVWGTYDCLDYYYMQDSKETTSLEEAQKMLQEIANKEIVRHGIV